jgi:phospholipid/cholesterol/gamma-HCH transport system substrate-binding protein
VETKANHILIGSVVLAVVAAIFGFIVWLAKLEIDREFARYYIYFDGAVSGLTVGSDVLYNGIPIGSVKEIRIDPDNPRRVRVLAEVDATAPIRTDSYATLQLKGITGVTEVLIEGGTPTMPKLRPQAGEKYAVIASRPSKIQQIFEGAPEVVSSLLELLVRANDLLSNDNRVALAGILKDVNVLTTTIVARAENLAKLIDDLQATSNNLRDAAKSVNQITGKVDTLVVSTDNTLALVRGALANVDQLLDTDVRKIIAEGTKLGSELGQIAAENRMPINEFATEGLADFARMVREMRALVSSLTRVSEKIEADPTRFLFGSQQGFKPQ